DPLASAPDQTVSTVRSAMLIAVSLLAEMPGSQSASGVEPESSERIKTITDLFKLQRVGCCC
uniref:hypothetical protein n=1 Tax=Methylobacterium nigriterrae TaxID=3127512 RepID=UPI0030136595